ncbi:MAG: hypothetical protein L3J93_01680, partial [Thermoplasmata archaeon]|nr:hypothetical protein [Thermoplasmata archaeon]
MSDRPFPPGGRGSSGRAAFRVAGRVAERPTTDDLVARTLGAQIARLEEDLSDSQSKAGSWRFAFGKLADSFEVPGTPNPQDGHMGDERSTAARESDPLQTEVDRARERLNLSASLGELRVHDPRAREVRKPPERAEAQAESILRPRNRGEHG